jgi:hypothetical protein
VDYGVGYFDSLYVDDVLTDDFGDVDAWDVLAGTATASTAHAHTAVDFRVDYIDYSSSDDFTAVGTVSATADHFGFVTIDDELYFNSPYNVVAKSNGVTASAVTGTTPAGGFLVALKRRLFTAGKATDGALLEYTDVDDIENWATVNASHDPGALRVAGVDSGGDCTGLAVWNKQLYYTSPSALYEITVEGTPANWTVQQVTARHGCIAPKTLQETPNGLVMLAADGVWLFGRNTDFSQEPGWVHLSRNITPTLKTITPDMLSAAAGAYYDGRYWLSCALNGSTTNNAVLVYRFPTQDMSGAWTLYEGSVAQPSRSRASVSPATTSTACTQDRR